MPVGAVPPALNPGLECASLLSEAFGGVVTEDLLGTVRAILDRPRTLLVGSIHGDLNLANVLVDLEARTVRLIDFEASREDHVLHDLLRLETGGPDALAGRRAGRG